MLRAFKSPLGKILLVLFSLAVVSGSVLAAYLLLKNRSPGERARSFYEHGVMLAQQHDYAKAEIELQNALRLQQDQLPAWRVLVQIQEKLQHWDGLIRSLQSIVGLDPADVEARIKLIKLFTIGGRLYQALELTKASDDAESQNSKILGLRAAVLYRLNEKIAAVRQAQAVIAIDPDNADALVVLATDKMANGDAESGLAILKSNAALYDNDIGIQLLKLKIFEQLKDSKSYEALLRQLIDSHPEGNAFRSQLIKFYVSQHRADDAENEMRAMVKANPASDEAELALVRLLYSTKGPSAARQELLARINAGGDVFSYQIALADLALAEGNSSEAEQLLQKLIGGESSPKQALIAQNKLAEIYLKANKIDAADAVVSEVLRKDGRNIDGLKTQAAIRIARGQPEPAIADLQSALTDQPRSTDVMLLLALAYERIGSIGSAEKQYADAVKISDYNPAIGLSYSGFLQRRGKFDRAEQFLVELSKRWPKNINVLVALARVELARGDWAGAQATAQSVRGVGDTSGMADQLLGQALYGQRKYDESIAAFQSAADASPSAAQPMASLVQALVRAKKTDKAVEFLKSALQANPDNAEAHVLMGSLELNAGTPDRAVESFKLAIEKQPKNFVGYQALANYYTREKKFDDAIAVLRSGLQLQPKSILLQNAIAGVFEQAGQFEAAISEYERILNENPGSMAAANNLASLLSDHRDDKASLEKARSLVASLQESPIPQFKDTLGWLSYRRGDYAIAISLLEKAATALPDVPIVRYHLGMSYVAVGQVANASEQLNKALSLAPDGELEKKIRDALSKLAS